MLFQAIDNRFINVQNELNCSRKPFVMKLFINVLLIAMSAICTAKLFWPDTFKELLVFEATWVVTIIIYGYIIRSLVKLRIPNPEQGLMWAGFSIYTTSFWLAWQITEQTSSTRNYPGIIIISLVSGFVGLVLCFLLANSFDRFKKTW